MRLINKKYILIVIGGLLSIDSFSQESLMFLNYYLDPFLINPAVTGSEIYPKADLSLNKQWLAFPGSPSTFSLAADCRIGFWDFYDPKGFVNKGPLKLKDRIGLGAALFRDNNGPLATTGFAISYAYHIPVNESSRLSLGMSLLGSQYSINSNLLKPGQPNDPILFSGNSNSFRLNFGFGAYYYTPNYFAGISATHILADKENVNGETKEQPDIFMMAGYKLFKDNYLITIEPSFVIKKFAATNLAFDLHTKVYVRKLNWIAISYSTTKIVNVMLGMHLYKMVYIGYNYGYSVSKIASFNYGTHEIHLGINLGLTGIEGIRTTVSDSNN